MEATPSPSRPFKTFGSLVMKRKRSHFSENEKVMIINVFKHVRETWPAEKYRSQEEMKDKTADILGISKSAVYRILKEYVLTDTVKPAASPKKCSSAVGKKDSAIQMEVVADVYQHKQQMQQQSRRNIQSTRKQPYSNAERQRRYREKRKAAKINACTLSQSIDSDVQPQQEQPQHDVQINKHQPQSNAERQRKYRKLLREQKKHTSTIHQQQNVDPAERARKRHLNKQRQSRFRARQRFESPSTSSHQAQAERVSKMKKQQRGWVFVGPGKDEPIKINNKNNTADVKEEPEWETDSDVLQQVKQELTDDADTGDAEEACLPIDIEIKQEVEVGPVQLQPQDIYYSYKIKKEEIKKR